MKASVQRRALSGLMGATLLTMVMFLPAAQITDAAYVDSEYGTAQVAAATLAPPFIVDTPLCVRPPLLGSGNVVTILWRWPSATPPYSTFTPASNVRWKVGTTDGVAVSSSGPDGQGRYSTTFSTGLLDGLIDGLLGVNISIEMRTVSENWTSARVSKMVYHSPVLILPASCTITNG